MKSWTTCNNKIEIIKLMAKRCNCYLVRKDDLAVLVDTSIHYEGKTLLRRLADLQVKMLHCILLTHVHFDHVGNARRLQEKFSSPIFVHSSEQHYLQEGYTPLPKGTMPQTKILTNLASNRIMKFLRFPACQDKLVTELSYDASPVPDLSLMPIEILPTPGHTTGSVSYIVDHEAALVGDTMVNPFGGTTMPPFADCPELLPESWKALLETNCQYFLPAHGGEISREMLALNYNRYCF